MHATPDSWQLDIFADGAPVMLRNELVDALARRDLAASRQATDRLRADCARDDLLAPACVLIDALAGHLAGELPGAALGSAAATSGLADARALLLTRILPAARTLFGASEGTAWLRPFWRELALHHASTTWDGARPDDHPAPSWLAACEFDQAARSVASIASWRRIPGPLCWMSEARYRLEGLDEVWPLLVELAWLSPRRLGGLLAELRDPVLDRLQSRFAEEFDAGATPVHDPSTVLAWLPAWTLSRTAALAPRLAAAEPGQDTPPERGLRLMVQLLTLERQGRHQELMARRQALRDLSAPLYRSYMATR